MSAICLAQNGQLAGIVTDQQGRPLTGARVEVSHQQTGIQRRDITNDAGSYSLPSLQPGTYRVGVEMTGFDSVAQSGVKLNTAQNAKLDFQMRVQRVDTNVTVEAAVTLVNYSRAVISTTITREVTATLPLNGRAYSDLTLLVPGVRRASLNRGEGTLRHLIREPAIAGAVRIVVDAVDHEVVERTRQAIHIERRLALER